MPYLVSQDAYTSMNKLETEGTLKYSNVSSYSDIIYMPQAFYFLLLSKTVAVDCFLLLTVAHDDNSDSNDDTSL